MTAADDVTAYLTDIADAARKARNFLGPLTLAEFSADEKTAFAVIRALEILGEAAKRIPQDLRDKYPDVPWRSMTAIRDKLIHDYVNVNLEVVWKTVTQDLPSLILAIERIITEKSR